MINEFVLIAAAPFQPKEGSHTDKNGKQNIFLKPLAGKMPNKAMVLAGSVAEQAGILPGKVYLCMVTERNPDAQYGRQFSVTNLGEVAPKDILGQSKEIGAVTIIDVTGGAAATQEEGLNLNQSAGATPALNSSALPVGTPAAEEVEP